VALLGFSLRSKILFPIHFIDYRNFLSAHSHFAFAGWAGLCLMTMLIHDLLPQPVSQKNIYRWILGGIAISSLGMAFTFPFFGYNAVSMFFSSLYIVVTLVFAPVFIKDVSRSGITGMVRLLSISAVCSLIISFLGTLGLIYILVTKSGNSLLYRDSIYMFLHFEYNGFFTLSVFALFFDYLAKKGTPPGKNANRFSKLLVISIIPSLFLSLLWHNNTLYYALAGAGCVLMLSSLYFFFGMLKTIRPAELFPSSMAKTFWYFSVFSFGLKMLLNVGTIFPALGNAVYGDRPVIIGFLHLVFLGFLTFYLLAILINQQYFHRNMRLMTIPFYIFSSGIIANELLLMIQGLGILFKTNNTIFQWLLWGASSLLLAGALLIYLSRISVI
jgi:hypothetical protein